MTQYVFWWIARPDENETEEVMYLSSAKQARAYAAKILRTETVAQYGKAYWLNPKVQNKIPLSAKIVDIITSRGLSATIVLFKNKLYVVKIKKNTRGGYQVFYPMSANGDVGSRPVAI